MPIPHGAERNYCSRNVVKNRKTFLRSSSKTLSAADNKSVEAIYRVHNKNSGFQKGEVSTR